MVKTVSTDPGRWAGFTNDPAETTTWCGWIRLAGWTLYTYPWKISLYRQALRPYDPGRMAYITLLWESPWERLMAWLWAIRRRDGTIRREIIPGTLRDRLACACDRRDARWRKRWALSFDDPPHRWRRQR